MAEQDPSKTFFPDQDEPDLYGCLGVEETATQDEIRKAYRKLALKCHPDKGGDEKQFQQVGYAYAVLSDEKRRKRFDDTGRTDESFFEGEADWNAYFKELWKGEVNEKTLDDFVKSYKGSDEEREAILSTYTEHEGSLGELFEHVMCSSVLDDEERFIEIVNAAIKAKEVSSYPRWKKDVKDTKARNKRKADAKGEAAEAEELAKELGVHDKLYGDGANGKQGKKAAAKGKGKNVNEDGVDEDALKALIQSRNAQKNTMGDLIERMEAKYAAEEAASSKKGKKKGRKADEDNEEDNAESSTHSKKKQRGNGSAKDAPSGEPTEEEFAALQEKLFAKKGKEEEAAPAKKAKRGKRG